MSRGKAGWSFGIDLALRARPPDAQNPRAGGPDEAGAIFRNSRSPICRTAGLPEQDSFWMAGATDPSMMT